MLKRPGDAVVSRLKCNTAGSKWPQETQIHSGALYSGGSLYPFKILYENTHLALNHMKHK